MDLGSIYCSCRFVSKLCNHGLYMLAFPCKFQNVLLDCDSDHPTGYKFNKGSNIVRKFSAYVLLCFSKGYGFILAQLMVLLLVF